MGAWCMFGHVVCRVGHQLHCVASTLQWVSHLWSPRKEQGKEQYLEGWFPMDEGPRTITSRTSRWTCQPSGLCWDVGAARTHGRPQEMREGGGVQECPQTPFGKGGGVPGRDALWEGGGREYSREVKKALTSTCKCGLRANVWRVEIGWRAVGQWTESVGGSPACHCSFKTGLYRRGLGRGGCVSGTSLR